EAVEQRVEAPLLDHPVELRPIVGERGAGEPVLEVGERARAIFFRDGELREAALALGALGGCAHADLRTCALPRRCVASARAVASGSWRISASCDARSARTIRYRAPPGAPRSSTTGAAPSRA